MKGVFLLLASVPLATAVCPNSCSGNGVCGEYDSCTCYANYRGADCSQRICPYAPAWVTTAKGDLNFDGDRVDYTVYNTDSKIIDGFETFTTQEFTGGDWESWPAYGVSGEGHFYMECANRGLCDRDTGECACFAGYEGSACQRMVCPNDCSGKGTCQSTDFLTANPSTVLTDWYDVAQSSATYAMWDGEMAMACKCDPGYAGPDCSVRMCPVGDDALTKTNQVYETQFIDIYTPCEGTSGETTTDCPTASATSTIGGSVTITFTDHFGEQYTTAPIDGLGAYEGADTVFAANAQAALRALPNKVFSQTATVHSAFCEYLEPSQTAVSAGVATIGGSATTHATRVLSPSSCVSTMGNTVYGADGKVKVLGNNKGSAGTGFSKEDAGTGADCTNGEISIIETPLCHRLIVNFNGMAGDYPDLQVNVAEATHNGKTNAQSAGSRMTSTVTSRLKIASSTVTVGYNSPSDVQVTNAAAYIAAGSTSTTITMGAAVLSVGVTSRFFPTTRVKVECGGASASSWRNLGIYTVASSTDTVLTLDEVIPASTIHTDCGTSGTPANVRVTMVSHVIRTGADADTADATATDTSIDAGLIMGNLMGTAAIPLRIGVTLGSGTHTIFEWASHYSSSSHAATLSSGATAMTGIIIVDSESTVSIGKNAHQSGGAAAGKGTILGSSVATTAAAIDEDILETDTAGVLYVEGDGTHENVECGARGLCDTEAGECKCFAGYTGLACGMQNALVL